MSAMRDALRDYLAMRRALGFKLVSDGTALLSFVAFLEEARADYISTEIALAWAQIPTSVQPAQWARRLGFVRGFARYCSAIDPRNEIPPVGLLPFEYQRQAPYFFSDKDIEALLLAALARPAKDGLANHTYHCLLGLLSVTGLRISEALNLMLDDVDLVDGILTIRSSKFGKSRMVPLHFSTVTALVDYRERRGRFLAGRQIPHWFVNRRGTKVLCDAVEGMFRRLADRLGLVGKKGKRRPRIHDLRHRFAMQTLMRWYDNGQDIERLLPVLSAYLGHVEVRDTYWYLSGFPQLLAAAKDRLERRWEVTL
ncbi:putative integrase/recombinase y4rB [Acidocella aquatica]|uniref:Integrase/recombinase y4rB n=1 Tax=Acidocella aquatica TaxID=1922313 RepID=A0ABQ6AA64_9PROT|nr:tyrosine-type recombinase/integrase [Acidocella aquatica]GLR69081.1 putative integrase/recombinase y4rB [Acidocella aquatica]